MLRDETDVDSTLSFDERLCLHSMATTMTEVPDRRLPMLDLVQGVSEIDFHLNEGNAGIKDSLVLVQSMSKLVFERAEIFHAFVDCLVAHSTILFELLGRTRIAFVWTVDQFSLTAVSKVSKGLFTGAT